ncbi:MAG: hypothetical protein ACYC4N_26325 [Pirellulaceae bacterium]
MRKLLGGRLAALLIVMAIPVLFATGVVSLKWEEGRPRLSFNEQRAAQVEQEAVQKVQTLSKKYADRDKTTLAIPSFSDTPQNASLGQQAQALADGISQLSQQEWGLPPGPAAAPPKADSKSELRTLSRLKDKVEDWRKQAGK